MKKVKVKGEGEERKVKVKGEGEERKVKGQRSEVSAKEGGNK